MVNLERHAGEGPGRTPCPRTHPGPPFPPGHDCAEAVPEVTLSGGSSAPCPQWSSRTRRATPVVAAMPLEQKEDPLLKAPQLLPPPSPGHSGMPRVCDITAGEEPGPARVGGRDGEEGAPWGRGEQGPFSSPLVSSFFRPVGPGTWQNPAIQLRAKEVAGRRLGLTEPRAGAGRAAGVVPRPPHVPRALQQQPPSPPLGESRSTRTGETTPWQALTRAQLGPVCAQSCPALQPHGL